MAEVDAMQELLDAVVHEGGGSRTTMRACEGDCRHEGASKKSGAAAFGQGDANATHLRRTGDRSGDRRGRTRVGTILDVCRVWPGRGVWV
jgi:hypothetical protein